MKYDINTKYKQDIRIKKILMFFVAIIFLCFGIYLLFSFKYYTNFSNDDWLGKILLKLEQKEFLLNYKIKNIDVSILKKNITELLPINKTDLIFTNVKKKLNANEYQNINYIDNANSPLAMYTTVLDNDYKLSLSKRVLALFPGDKIAVKQSLALNWQNNIYFSCIGATKDRLDRKILVKVLNNDNEKKVYKVSPLGNLFTIKLDSLFIQDGFTLEIEKNSPCVLIIWGKEYNNKIKKSTIYLTVDKTEEKLDLEKINNSLYLSQKINKIIPSSNNKYINFASTLTLDLSSNTGFLPIDKDYFALFKDKIQTIPSLLSSFGYLTAQINVNSKQTNILENNNYIQNFISQNFDFVINIERQDEIYNALSAVINQTDILKIATFLNININFEADNIKLNNNNYLYNNSSFIKLLFANKNLFINKQKSLYYEKNNQLQNFISYLFSKTKTDFNYIILNQKINSIVSHDKIYNGELFLYNFNFTHNNENKKLIFSQKNIADFLVNLKNADQVYKNIDIALVQNEYDEYFILNDGYLKINPNFSDKTENVIEYRASFENVLKLYNKYNITQSKNKLLKIKTPKIDENNVEIKIHSTNPFLLCTYNNGDLLYKAEKLLNEHILNIKINNLNNLIMYCFVNNIKIDNKMMTISVLKNDVIQNKINYRIGDYSIIPFFNIKSDTILNIEGDKFDDIYTAFFEPKINEELEHIYLWLSSYFTWTKLNKTIPIVYDDKTFNIETKDIDL